MTDVSGEVPYRVGLVDLDGLAGDVAHRFMTRLSGDGWAVSAEPHQLEPSADVWLVAGKGGVASRAVVDRFCRRRSGARVVVVSAEVNDVEMLAVLRAGASGYLPADFPPERLSAVLLGVVQGELALSRRHTARLAHEFRTAPARRYFTLEGKSVELTPAQAEVFGLLRSGLTTRQIATRLHLEAVTVRSHAAAIRRRLGARRWAELVMPDEDRWPAKR